MIKPSEVLERMEWMQGRMYNYTYTKDGNKYPSIVGCCMVGAWNQAYNKASEKECNTLVERWERLRAHLGIPLADWNDKPERTKEQVIAKLKEFDL